MSVVRASRQPGLPARVAFLVTVFLAIACASTPLQAGKVYKIIDENGRVTYTDKPPKPAEDTAIQSEQLDIQEGSGNRTLLTRLGNSEYCGHLKMPSDNGYRGRFLEHVIQARTQWQTQLRQMETLSTTGSHYNGTYDYRRYSQPKFNQHNSPENLEKMRDYRCGIAWADQTEETLKQEKTDLVNKVAHQNEHLNELVRRKAATCGDEPEFGVPNLQARRNDWQTCSAEFDAQIREGQRALQEADEKLTAIQKTER